MTARFTSTPVDHRRLTMLPHRIANMHPGRREHIYGRIQPLHSRPVESAFMRFFPIVIGLLVGAVLIGVM